MLLSTSRRRTSLVRGHTSVMRSGRVTVRIGWAIAAGRVKVVHARRRRMKRLVHGHNAGGGGVGLGEGGSIGLGVGGVGVEGLEAGVRSAVISVGSGRVTVGIR